MPLDVEELYRCHGPLVLRRCRRLLRDPQEAVDAMHDVFVEVLRREPSLQVENAAGLLFRTATHVCLNRLRTARRRPGDAPATAEPLLHEIASLEEPEEHASARNFLQRVLGGEPESTRVILTLHLLDGLTLEEVAAEVGLSVSGVRKRIRTFRARLPEAA